MSRSFADLTPEEQSLYRIHKRRTENDLCSAAEKKESREAMEAMLHVGPTGPVMDKIAALEARIDELETKKGGKLTKKAEADLVAHVLDEAKTAIMAEAEAAAKEAVAKLMGDSF